MHLGDEDLLLRIAGGDDQAFAALYDRYSARVFGLIKKILRDSAEAEDVLQEVMWEVWRKASHFEARLGSPTSWILMLARARAIDRVRSLQRRAKHAADFALEASEEPVFSHETMLEGSAALKLLEALPEEQRTVIALAFYNGLSREQIAELQGIPVGTVKTRIRNGVMRMREMFEAETSTAA
jgi:RNA polymerase sigma-70 factor, ECF subfamily